MAMMQPTGSKYSQRQTEAAKPGGWEGATGITGGKSPGVDKWTGKTLDMTYDGAAALMGGTLGTAIGGPVVGIMLAGLFGAGAQAIRHQAMPGKGPEYAPGTMDKLQQLAPAQETERPRQMAEGPPRQMAQAPQMGGGAGEGMGGGGAGASSQIMQQLLSYQQTDPMALGAGALRGFGGKKGAA